MPTRLALKPDSSFFRKIAIGAVGTRAICSDLAQLGHTLVELERGSLDTKLWKDVKRKRVRIPDLVCTRCGLRVESRAKTKPELSMSHSPNEESRAWDFGMVDSDIIAFPVCETTNDAYWSAGYLGASHSYWHERTWADWRCHKRINYLRVGAFRQKRHARSTTKGVTEGSETAIAWDATFCTRDGIVDFVDGQKVRVVRLSNSHSYTWSVPANQVVVVTAGERVAVNQILASSVDPVPHSDLTCPRRYPDDLIPSLIQSRERTLRFTGVKMARLNGASSFREQVRSLESDPVEDIYVRLEAASYLASVCETPAHELFAPYLSSGDEQVQLEAVIALGEAATPDAVPVLAQILDDVNAPYFLRSAAAWSLGRIGGDVAIARLVAAFSDVDTDLRSEALEGIVAIGGDSLPRLVKGLSEEDRAVAAGCAEALRQQSPLPDAIVASITSALRMPNPSTWTVWLSAHLPKDQIAGVISELQQTAPQLHYALTVLWSFLESWIAKHWECAPRPASDTGETCNAT